MAPPCGFNCRCTQISLTEDQAVARGYGKQVRPEAQPDPGFGNANSVLDALKGTIEKLKNLCVAFLFAKKRTSPPIHCDKPAAAALDRLSGIARADGSFPEPRKLDLVPLPAGLPEQIYLESFMRWFGEPWKGEAVVASASGHQFAVSRAIFTVQQQSGESKTLKQGRASYVDYLAQSILAPDQAWLSETADELMLLSRFIVRGELLHTIAVFRFANGIWAGVTTYPTLRASYWASKATGILAYQRPET